VLGRQSLDEDLARLPKRDQILHIDLAGRDPDDGATEIPYEKGALLLRHLEDIFGRDSLDHFLRTYFDSFAFQSITTTTAVNFLTAHLLSTQNKYLDLHEWIYEPGLPASAPSVHSDRLSRAEREAHKWWQ